MSCGAQRETWLTGMTDEEHGVHFALVSAPIDY